MNEPRVHYIGNDILFLNGMEAFFKGLKQRIEHSHSLEDLIHLCIRLSPAIVFVDFTMIKEVHSVIGQVNYLKKNVSFRSVLFVAIFENVEDLKKEEYIFSSGFQLSYIKGGEISSLLRDCVYIALNEVTAFPSYAMASGMSRKIQASAPSTITEIDSTGFVVETDFETTSNKLSITQNIFPELKEVEITSDSSPAAMYPMMTSYQLLFPAPDPWADDSSFTLLPETVETWISLHKELLTIKKENVFIVEPSFQFLSEAFQLEQKSQLSMHYFKTLEDSFAKIDTLRPSLIFIQIDQDERHPNSIHKVEKLIDLFRYKVEYLPIVILTSMVSSSVAVQKLLNYDLMLSHYEKLHWSLVQKFSELYSNKRVLQKEDSMRFFALTSRERLIDINFSIIVRRMTEHEVVFSCEEDLPMFTVLHFLEPVEFFATLIPALIERTGDAKAKLKTAIIHGLTENTLESLRQLINILIVNPNVDFKVSEVKVPGSIPVMNLIEETPKESEQTVATKIEIKTRYHGKSKL